MAGIDKYNKIADRYEDAYFELNGERVHTSYSVGWVFVRSSLGESKYRVAVFEEMAKTLEKRMVEKHPEKAPKIRFDKKTFKGIEITAIQSKKMINTLIEIHQQYIDLGERNLNFQESMNHETIYKILLDIKPD